eukprot:268198_1
MMWRRVITHSFVIILSVLLRECASSSINLNRRDSAASYASTTSSNPPPPGKVADPENYFAAWTSNNKSWHNIFSDKGKQRSYDEFYSLTYTSHEESHSRLPLLAGTDPTFETTLEEVTGHDNFETYLTNESSEYFVDAINDTTAGLSVKEGEDSNTPSSSAPVNLFYNPDSSSEDETDDRDAELRMSNRNGLDDSKAPSSTASMNPFYKPGASSEDEMNEKDGKLQITNQNDFEDTKT